ncbi:putative hydrolase of the HAD superfamily [Actinoalloteichus hoggarensis]|uniref:Pyrimidine 5'-nucleotidase YjjG n=1 Tax=Actinoalloteichus hoggarensis TaxID=1470176 RepID=A0A221W561_9PSEU|nr:HAD family hydrolase [Actinoalloteichus hoggarensis]ASO21042.1 Pyrimidine 5'-nucleotidase YjjG [Actinoalloteichus hoggarensis]MBB5920973.1 putative hydrolase of the HAD superfamily [Actinoalloteichus hoggarensis]
MGLALFDLDNTLVDRVQAFHRWAREFSAAHALGAHAVGLLLAIDDDGRLPLDRFFETVRDRFGLAATADDLYADFRRDYPGHASCPREVLAGLTALRAAGWRVGVVTNGPTALQDAVLDGTGLTAVLDGWVVSEAAGVRKPDPEIFALAARRCGTDLTDSWMTGDHPDGDVMGGMSSGARTIWVRRDRAWPERLPPPAYQVDTVLEALRIISDHSADSPHQP